MKRLLPGQYQAMTDEEKAAHRKALRDAWVKKPGNKKKLRNWNIEYQRKHWLDIRDKFFMRICVKCGKLKPIRARGTICTECKNIKSKTRIFFEQQQERKQQRILVEQNVIKLAKLGMLQREIAEEVGIYQEQVSKILCRNGLRRNDYKKRK